jgi:hypothetical protein
MKTTCGSASTYVFTAVIINSSIFWGVTSGFPLEVNGRFAECVASAFRVEEKVNQETEASVGSQRTTQGFISQNVENT